VATFRADGNEYEIRKIIVRAFKHDFPLETEKLLRLLPPPVEVYSGGARRSNEMRAVSWFRKRFSYERATV